MKVQKMNYQNPKDKQYFDFEIIKIRKFFEKHPQKLLETDVRLEFWVLLYITKGSGVHYIDFKKYPYKSGDLIIIERRRVHSFKVNNDVEGYVINLNEPFFFEDSENNNMDLLAFFETPDERPILSIDMSSNSTNKILIDLIYKEYSENHDYSSRNLIRSLFKSFIFSLYLKEKDKIIHSSTMEYKYYNKYRELIELNFRNLKIVNDYSKLIGVSVKTINTACKKCADISAKQLLINRIILEAKRLLVKGDMKIYQISYYLGFNEPANFSAFFKKHTGMSTNDFKNIIKLKEYK
ncbi:MAG: helix-turn-helix transcriptional regulator [Fusobacterium sp. JB021]|nr:helix-turn-helix transcriptional regulator [Fusobacterium sp. JB020]MDP0493532.1 helix-turn-helix transcriptional regulator [Fusobacterium sp. JB021]MDP0506133.1 helix-turn-helix transcriptional regulator [Fusobacterium sp. JB019]